MEEAKTRDDLASNVEERYDCLVRHADETKKDILAEIEKRKNDEHTAALNQIVARLDRLERDIASLKSDEDALE